MPLPEPANAARGTWVPLLLNAGLLLLLYLLARAFAGASSGTGEPRASEVAYALFFLTLGLCLLDTVLGIVCAVLGKKRWAFGWAMSGLLALLVGLGSCGYTLSHLT